MVERETLDVDVLIVGAGPAGLACALHIKRLFARQPSQPSVWILEKGARAGAHIVSGAILDPRALNELVPGWARRGAPVKQAVTAGELLYLSENSARRIPKWLVPPYLRNTGNFIVSLGALTEWLAEEARAAGVEVLDGVAGAELLMQGMAVRGVRCGDHGLDREGRPRANYQPGAEIRAKVTVLAEGVHGSLTGQLIGKAGLNLDRAPQTHALGFKELWELPGGVFPPGKTLHTLGYPLQSGLGLSAPDAFGGGFLYGLDETHLAVGLAAGLDYENAAFDPHARFNRFKNHPFVRTLLAKGKILGHGAKTIPEGGYYAQPRFYGPGFCIVGDSGGFVNAARLKGVHLALKSGMLAAEAIGKAWTSGDFSEKALGGYEDRFQTSWARAELFAVRNWRAAFAGGSICGAIHDRVQRWTGGRGLADPLPVRASRQTLRPGTGGGASEDLADGVVAFDKSTGVFHAKVSHEREQPCHLLVPDRKLCADRCAREFGNPCQHFCPAGVYEWVLKKESGELLLHPENCLHCKTCGVKDPYENIVWRPPEGGGGPHYAEM